MVGTVIDKNTERPVNFASVSVLGTNNSTITDSLGKFHLSIIKSGLQCYCNAKEKITISSPLYLTDTFALNETKCKIQADTLYIKKFFDPKKDFMNKWVYFNLTDNIELKVIHHIPATMKCEGAILTYSITIGTINSGDTIRILELCNRTKDFNEDEIVYVMPTKIPSENYTNPRVFVQGYQGQLKPQQFDTMVLKTTYGIIYRK